MKIIDLPRGKGKTTLLILFSHFLNYRIITTSHFEADRIQKLAKTMGINIPTPCDICTYKEQKGLNDKGILIDEWFRMFLKLVRLYIPNKTTDIVAGTWSSEDCGK